MGFLIPEHGNKKKSITIRVALWVRGIMGFTLGFAAGR